MNIPSIPKLSVPPFLMGKIGLKLTSKQNHTVIWSLTKKDPYMGPTYLSTVGTYIGYIRLLY